jgi:Tol biopolymer transport system component
LANGAGSDEMLADTPDSKVVEDWSPDGKFILYNIASTSIWALPVAGDHKPFPLLDTPFAELEAKISADSHWMAYRSDESGQAEVFIQSFPPSGGKWQISSSGGRQPYWRADGKELFYLKGTKVMAVDIKTSAAGVETGTPKELFDVPGLPLDARRNVYVVTRDGQRFLCQTMAESVNSNPLILLQNWPATLKK